MRLGNEFHGRAWRQSRDNFFELAISDKRTAFLPGAGMVLGGLSDCANLFVCGH
jgi:hypothetical protein